MSRGVRLVAVAGALALAIPVMAQERYTVAGGDVALYNLAGDVTVTGSRGANVTVEALRWGATPTDWTFDTGSGRVTVALPADLGASLEIETGSGGIDVDFPVMVTRRARGDLRGTIGDGSGSIVIDTASGSIRIRSQ